MSSPLQLHILHATTDNALEDSALMERLWKQMAESLRLTLGKPKVLDIREPLSACDIQVHLEIPVYAAIPWAHVNMVCVTPERWSSAYEDYLHAFDGFLFRDHHAAMAFQQEWRARGWTEAADRIIVLPWYSSWNPLTSVTRSLPRRKEFVCLVGENTSRATYVKEVLRAWREEDPPLTIYTTLESEFYDKSDKTEKADKDEKAEKANVRIIRKELTVQEQQEILWLHQGHLVVSQAESFGYDAAHSESRGGFAIMNQLHTFMAQYPDSRGVAWLRNTYSERKASMKAYPQAYPLAYPQAYTLRSELETAFEQFQNYTTEMEEFRIQRSIAREKEALLVFQEVMKGMIHLVVERFACHARVLKKGIRHLPPILEQTECPSITIITPTFQRKRLMEIAYHNLLSTDYPHNKIEWIVIEDNDKFPHIMAGSIAEFQKKAPTLQIRHLMLEGRRSIGEKRNKGVEAATHDIILFMDDDDHYPPTSFRRRVAWLTRGIVAGRAPRVTCCTTLALYDLNRGVSAVNVPPFELPLCQRISEATLTFYKSVWNERAFPEVSISEGEAWLKGRESDVLEMPPQQMIVAFSHSENQSSRRLPASDQPPSCFWGFPREYLVFIHGLVGVDVMLPSKKTG